jgi:hypothetical protein
MHPKDPTLRCHAELGSMVSDKRVPYSDSLVKYSGGFSEDISLFLGSLQLSF